jgi:hypothetical protein
MGYDAEFWKWDEDTREIYEERLAILLDGRPITPSADRIARVEARKEQAYAIGRRACSRCGISFEFGKL